MLESQLQSKWLTKLKKDLHSSWIMKASTTNLKGAPDCFIAYKSKAIFIEFKIVPNKLSPKQEYERDRIIKAECLYLVVDQFTDYENILQTINTWCA